MADIFTKRVWQATLVTKDVDRNTYFFVNNHSTKHLVAKLLPHPMPNAPQVKICKSAEDYCSADWYHLPKLS